MYLQCETVIEEFEDELIAMFKEEQDSVKEKFCVDVAGRYLNVNYLCGREISWDCDEACILNWQ